MFLVLLFSVLSFLGGASANVCTSYFHGQCYDMFSGLNGACSPGHVYTLNYCGVFQMCCYYQTSYHVTSAPLTFAPHVTPAPTAPHTGTFGSAQCGTTLVGSTSQKIVGGSIAQHGEFPWQVSLRYYGQHVCGGTLVGDQWVITAAHCFEELGNYASQWSVAVGVQDRRSIYSNNIVHVSAIYPHEYFDQPTNSNDIAVMRLSKKVDITGRYTRAACLPQQSDTFSADICTVSGWGATRYDPDGKAPITNQLEYVNLRTITNTDCQYYLGYNSVHSTNICAGATSTGGKDACQGDSGGPKNITCKEYVCATVECKVANLEKTTNEKQEYIEITIDIYEKELAKEKDVREVKYATMAIVTDPAVWYGGKVVPWERTVYVEKWTTFVVEPTSVVSEINIWIIIGSVLGGLVLLVAIVSTLWRCGFFNRKTHSQVQEWKKNKQVSTIASIRRSADDNQPDTAIEERKQN